MQDFNDFVDKLSEATNITLKKGNRKSYAVEREDTIRIIQAAIQYYIKSYNEVIESDSSREEIMEKLNNMGGSLIDNLHPVNFKDKSYLDISYKKWYFAKMFLFFLKNRTAKTLPQVKEKVSKDKMMFVSRLIYTVGYHGKEYNNEYDDNGNKNRMLSNLLRKYAKEKFPTIVPKYYWS